MRIDRIGFGYVKNLGGYENYKLYIEAELESWEDPSQSLDLLRNRVAYELNLPEAWLNLKDKISRQEQALQIANAAVAAAEEKLKKVQHWETFTQTLIAHGLNLEELINEFGKRKFGESWTSRTTQQVDKTIEGGDDFPADPYYDPYYDGENDGGDDCIDPYYVWPDCDCDNENYWADTSPYLVEDDATLESEIEAILKNDKEILEELLPRLETLSWCEKIAVSQTAIFLLSTFSSKDPLLKLVSVRGDTLSIALRETMTILEGLSPHRLAEIATRILAEDIETEEKDSEKADSKCPHCGFAHKPGQNTLCKM